MPWSANFILELHRPNPSPRFLLEHVEGSGFEPGEGIRLSSHAVDGYRTALCRRGSRVTPGQLSIGDWSYSTPELTVGIDVDVTGLIARGQLLVLRVGWPGWSPGDYETVFVGHLQSVDRSGDDWTLTIRHLLASLSSRMTVVGTEGTLFPGLGDSTLTSGYSPGDPTIDVADVVSLDIEGGAGAEYLLQIFPDSGDDPFFVTATGLTVLQFTGVSGAILGTTAVAAASGSEVKFCALIKDSPTRAIRRVMSSVVGDSSNGLYDTLPFSWGLGIPQELIDFDDCDRTKDVVQPSGSPSSDWHLYSTENQDDGLSWIQGVLGPAGMFVCDRQGQLTIRAMSAASVRDYTMTAISDADIASIDRHERWSGSSPVEFSSFVVQTPSTTDIEGEDLDSRPASSLQVNDLFYVEEDPTDWTAAVQDRILFWYTRVPEVVTVTCIGLRLAFLAPGDQVQIASRHVRTRDRATDPLFKVLSVGTDWFQGNVTLMLAYHPTAEREF